MSKIDTGYGYRLLKAGERIIETDEVFSVLEGWYRTSAAGGECHLGYYRRRIDPGEGYRLLSVGETILLGDEFYDDGKWIAPCGYGHKVTVTSCAFRRKVHAADGWIKLSDRLPEANQPFWAGGGCKPTCCHSIGVVEPALWIKCTDRTHWQPATIPAPPAPEKSEAELAWAKHCEKYLTRQGDMDVFFAGFEAAKKGAQ